jgi:hypothetical protein
MMRLRLLRVFRQRINDWNEYPFTILAFLVLFCPLLMVAQNMPTPSEDRITLSASIVTDADGGPAVRFSLRNTDKQAVTVLTGISTGSTPRPAEAFGFTLAFADGHKTQLFCASSLCPPPIIGGSISPYTIHLLPGQMSTLEIPLADLHMPRGSFRLCTPATEGAQLVVSLTGRSQQENVLGGSLKGPYWKGTVFESIPLHCQRN